MLEQDDPSVKRTCFEVSCWAMHTLVNHCACVVRRNVVDSVVLHGDRVVVCHPDACAEHLSSAASDRGKELYGLSLFGFELATQREVQL